MDLGSESESGSFHDSPCTIYSLCPRNDEDGQDDWWKAAGTDSPGAPSDVGELHEHCERVAASSHFRYFLPVHYLTGKKKSLYSKLLKFIFFCCSVACPSGWVKWDLIDWVLLDGCSWLAKNQYSSSVMSSFSCSLFEAAFPVAQLCSHSSTRLLF